jgi:hypothetical protein
VPWGANARLAFFFPPPLALPVVVFSPARPRNSLAGVLWAGVQTQGMLCPSPAKPWRSMGPLYFIIRYSLFRIRYSPYALSFPPAYPVCLVVALAKTEVDRGEHSRTDYTRGFFTVNYFIRSKCLLCFPNKI